jgi:AmiR/NasT family two-component response regulator
LLHERTTRETEAVVTQLQGALNSRVVIEQAKGMLAAKLNLSVEDAFGLLRCHARNRNRLLSEVAREVVEAEVEPEELAGAPAGR